MLYVGNFSYNDENDSVDNYCLLSCLVTADNADEALDKFSDLHWHYHRDTSTLDGARDIYLDSLVELENVPSEAVCCQWQKIQPTPDGLFSITNALPDVELPNANAYTFYDDSEQDIEIDFEDLDIDFDDLEETDESPFLSFKDE